MCDQSLQGYADRFVRAVMDVTQPVAHRPGDARRNYVSKNQNRPLRISN
jgi:hypothetical protein